MYLFLYRYITTRYRYRYKILPVHEMQVQGQVQVQKNVYLGTGTGTGTGTSTWPQPCCTPLLMTYFTEKNHNIWDRASMVKLKAGSVVAIFLAQSIFRYDCKSYIYGKNNFSDMFVLVWVGNKNIVIFMKFSFQNDGCQTQLHKS